MTMSLAGIGQLALIGCGKMGSALLEGWLKLGLPPHSVAVFDPHIAQDVAQELTQRAIAVNGVMAPVDIAVVAVKPQILEGILPNLRTLLQVRTLVISVVAGKTMARFAEGLGEHTAIIRTIPNTPAAIGRGVSVGVANDRASPEHKTLAASLLSAVGAFEWIEDEALMDAVTAVSGSGPAYVFHLVEALAAAAQQQGLPSSLAERLARLTIEGAGELLHQSSLSPAVLRQNVTSPGGTTAAALQYLMDEKTGFPALLNVAVAAATKRGRELAS